MRPASDEVLYLDSGGVHRTPETGESCSRLYVFSLNRYVSNRTGRAKVWLNSPAARFLQIGLLAFRRLCVIVRVLLLCGISRFYRCFSLCRARVSLQIHAKVKNRMSLNGLLLWPVFQARKRQFGRIGLLTSGSLNGRRMGLIPRCPSLRAKVLLLVQLSPRV